MTRQHRSRNTLIFDKNTLTYKDTDEKCTKDGFLHTFKSIIENREYNEVCSFIVNNMKIKIMKHQYYVSKVIKMIDYIYLMGDDKIIGGANTLVMDEKFSGDTASESDFLTYSQNTTDTTVMEILLRDLWHIPEIYKQSGGVGKYAVLSRIEIEADYSKQGISNRALSFIAKDILKEVNKVYLEATTYNRTGVTPISYVAEFPSYLIDEEELENWYIKHGFIKTPISKKISHLLCLMELKEHKDMGYVYDETGESKYMYEMSKEARERLYELFEVYEH